MKLSFIYLIAATTLATVSGSAFAAPTGPLHARRDLEQAFVRDDVDVYSRLSGVVVEREVLDDEELFTRTLSISKVSVGPLHCHSIDLT